MKNRTILFVTTLIFFNSGVQAAGFDCSLKTLNETERTICNTPYLSGIDNVANTLYINAVKNSLSIGTILSGQLKWLDERNSCKADIECIVQKYILRNDILSSVGSFEPLSKIFPPQLIDEPLEQGVTNENGFTIRDNPWLTKKLFSISSLQQKLNLTQGDWRFLTYLIIDDNIGFIFSLETKRITYLIYVSDIDSQSYVIDAYDSESSFSPGIRLTGRDDVSFTYEVDGVYDKEKDSTVSAYYKVSIADSGKVLAEPKKIIAAPESIEDELWTGYCGHFPCISSLTSPDGKWRIASGDSDIEGRNDGVYYFPHDRPDQGVNVFLSSHERNRNFSHYAWGDKNSFFFDNQGAMACIWKTDISKKTTECILPVEGLQRPIYIRFKNQDYVVSRYSSSRLKYVQDEYLEGFYISKESTH
ncbi:lysozyme inhibitor LprI family protein [Enterobacter cloacae subsp. dissolvens]